MSQNKVAVQFKVFKIFGLLPINAPPSARGELAVTYLDEEMRISRGDKGNLFVLLVGASVCSGRPGPHALGCMRWRAVQSAVAWMSEQVGELSSMRALLLGTGRGGSRRCGVMGHCLLFYSPLLC